MSFRSIEDLNRAIRNAQIDVKLTSFEQRFLETGDEASKSFARLLKIKPIHRNDPKIKRAYDKAREAQPSNTTKPEFFQTLAKQFSITLEKISLDQGGALQEDRVHRFLDLGYFPGGFSTWLLANNPHAKGVGVNKETPTVNQTLAAERDRYTIVTADITTLVLQAAENGRDTIIPLDANDGDDTEAPHQYDLVVGGAFPDIRKAKPEGDLLWWLRPQLVLSQLLIILTHTRKGGFAILHINTKPFAWMAEVVGILWATFAKVESTKGTTHLKITTGYLVCSECCGENEDTERYIRQIKTMLGHLEICSREEQAADEYDNELLIETLSGRTFDDIFSAEYQKVIGLFHPLWEKQYSKLYENMKGNIDQCQY